MRSHSIHRSSSSLTLKRHSVKASSTSSSHRIVSIMMLLLISMTLGAIFVSRKIHVNNSQKGTHYSPRDLTKLNNRVNLLHEHTTTTQDEIIRNQEVSGLSSRIGDNPNEISKENEIVRKKNEKERINSESFHRKNDREGAPSIDMLEPVAENPGDPPTVKNYQLPLGLQHVLRRAKAKQYFCHDLSLPKFINNNSLPDLSNHGIIHTLESYRPHSQQDIDQWNCRLPPPTECNETQFTVIFLGWNPERIEMLHAQLAAMTEPRKKIKIWNNLIHEVILVWNGPRELNDTKLGKIIHKWAANPRRDFRIIYPLKDGFPNDLMNRYHPRMNIKTKAILFYDDDGPFYKVKAITSGFELWKRNANAQIGAMARVLNVGKRQLEEKATYLQYSEHEWIGHCREKGDDVKYNFNYFANFGANMALPSGSFLHSDYLCFLWHPALAEIREFVRAHPVHPDDVTVSTIVSQVSGRSPKVYSRRINFEGWIGNAKATRQLLETNKSMEHRRLLWDDGDIFVWAQKREAAVNSLLSFFGSINSGAKGWCYGTPYHVKNEHQDNNTMGPDVCEPWIAKWFMLPWMTDELQELSNCPGLRIVT